MSDRDPFHVTRDDLIIPGEAGSEGRPRKVNPDNVEVLGVGEQPQPKSPFGSMGPEAMFKNIKVIRSGPLVFLLPILIPVFLVALIVMAIPLMIFGRILGGRIGGRLFGRGVIRRM